MDDAIYHPLETRAAYRAVCTVLAMLTALGLLAAHYMDSRGHHVTGMTNQVVWGLPHVCAVFLIVAASGALNAATLGASLGRAPYKPLARLSALLGMALLLGGLAILVLDLGRPDRLMVALTHYNPRSVFAWNVFLYIGFLIVTAVFLWTLMERRLASHAGRVGGVLLVWRVGLTTATGCVFGLLVARESYHAALLPLLFVAMSLSFGLAVFILSAAAGLRLAGGRGAGDLPAGLRPLLGLCCTAVLCLAAVDHAIRFSAADHRAMQRFFLLEPGIYPLLFWAGQVVAGGVLPMLITFHRGFEERAGALIAAAGLVVAGGLCQLYVLIIGAQAYPLALSKRFEVIESSFFDGEIARYAPSIPETALGAGGIAFSLLLFALGLRVLPCLPDRQSVDAMREASSSG